MQQKDAHGHVQNRESRFAPQQFVPERRRQEHDGHIDEVDQHDEGITQAEIVEQVHGVI